MEMSNSAFTIIHVSLGTDGKTCTTIIDNKHCLGMGRNVIAIYTPLI